MTILHSFPGSFLRQLGWELRRLAARPRSYLGFGACLALAIGLVALYRTTSLDEIIDQTVWRVPPELEDGLSGLTVATHVVGQTMALAAALFLALVGGDIVANESEERTLHMIFARPVTREAVLLQKLLACALYTTALALFVGATALGLGLLAYGPGALVVVSAREGIVGVHPFATGLHRYALAILLLAPCHFTITLLAFALSCWRVKPGAATVGALAILVADELVRIQPGLAAIAPYTLATRIRTWRHVFAYDVPWLRIERNLTDLLLIDLVLIALAWWTFRRRELAP